MTHMHSLKLAALYTLQHRLPRYAEELCGLNHRYEALWCSLHEVGFDRFVHADAPGSARSQLFSGDEAFFEPAVHGGRDDAEDLGGPLDGNGLAFGGLFGWSEPGDLPVLSETGDTSRGEAKSAGCLAALTIQDPRGRCVRVMGRKSPQEINGFFVGPYDRFPGMPKRHIDFSEHAATPTQRQVGLGLGAGHSDVDFLKQGSQQFLAIAVRGGGCFPCAIQIRAQAMNVLTLLVSQLLWPSMLASRQFGLSGGQFVQALFPLGFQCTSHEAILRLYGSVATLGPLGLHGCVILDSATGKLARRRRKGSELGHEGAGRGCEGVAEGVSGRFEAYSARV